MEKNRKEEEGNSAKAGSENSPQTELTPYQQVLAVLTLVNSTEQPELRSVGLGSSDRKFSPLYKAPAGHMN